MYCSAQFFLKVIAVSISGLTRSHFVKTQQTVVSSVDRLIHPFSFGELDVLSETFVTCKQPFS